MVGAVAAQPKKKKRKRTKKKKANHALQSEQPSSASAAAPAAVTVPDNGQEWEQLRPRIIAAIKYQILAAAVKHNISIEMAEKLVAAIDLSGFKK